MHCSWVTSPSFAGPRKSGPGEPSMMTPPPSSRSSACRTVPSLFLSRARSVKAKTLISQSIAAPASAYNRYGTTCGSGLSWGMAATLLSSCGAPQAQLRREGCGRLGAVPHDQGVGARVTAEGEQAGRVDSAGLRHSGQFQYRRALAGDPGQVHQVPGAARQLGDLRYAEAVEGCPQPAMAIVGHGAEGNGKLDLVPGPPAAIPAQRKSARPCTRPRVADYPYVPVSERDQVGKRSSRAERRYRLTHPPAVVPPGQHGREAGVVHTHCPDVISGDRTCLEQPEWQLVHLPAVPVIVPGAAGKHPHICSAEHDSGGDLVVAHPPADSRPAAAVPAQGEQMTVEPFAVAPLPEHPDVRGRRPGDREQIRALVSRGQRHALPGPTIPAADDRCLVRKRAGRLVDADSPHVPRR